MNSYFFRTLNRAALVQIGVDLDLLLDDATGTHSADEAICSWDEVGTLYEPTGQLNVDGDPIMRPIAVNGVPYFHANLLLRGDLNEWATARYADAVAGGDQALADRIAQHIADAPGFFVLDAQGAPRKPNAPQRVFWL